MRLALAALEACLRDERWVGMRGEAMEKEGEGMTHLQMSRRRVPLASQMGGGREGRGCPDA
jgi:hypothetical protein